MNPITEARQTLLEELSDTGAKVYDHWPQRAQGPCIVIDAGSPYVEVKGTKGEYQVRFNVYLFTKNATNSVLTEALDDLTVNVIEALNDWTIEVVLPPALTQIGDTVWVGTMITVKDYFKEEAID